MTDFSKARIRCSTIYGIMGGLSRKTPMQEYLDCAAEIADKQLRMANMKKKDGNGYAKLIATEEQLQACLKVLEIVKDQPLPLSPGAKTLCTTIYADIKYGKWNPTKDIGNKYTAKGKAAEEASIDLVSKLENQSFKKNELLVQNEFLRGTPDIIVGNDVYAAEKIVDVKSPWDCETFFGNLNDELVQQYKFQMQGYMAITNAPVAEVHFCMVDIPDFMWQKERQNLFNRMEVVTDEDIDFKIAEAQLFRNLHFGDMPPEERRIKFIVERDDELIKKIYEQVEKVREYLPIVEKMHLFGRDSVLLPEISEVIEKSENNPES